MQFTDGMAGCHAMTGWTVRRYERDGPAADVVVNGTLVIDGGEHTGARPGTVILGRGYKPGTPVSDGSESR